MLPGKSEIKSVSVVNFQFLYKLPGAALSAIIELLTRVSGAHIALGSTYPCANVIISPSTLQRTYTHMDDRTVHRSNDANAKLLSNQLMRLLAIN